LREPVKRLAQARVGANEQAAPHVRGHGDGDGGNWDTWGLQGTDDADRLAVVIRGI